MPTGLPPHQALDPHPGPTVQWLHPLLYPSLSWTLLSYMLSPQASSTPLMLSLFH